MSLLTLPLDQITAQDLDALRENRVAEDRLLEFKEMVGRNRAGTIDFLRHVSALANTAGGDVLIGVAEDPPGFPATFPGIALGDLDELKLFLGNLLRDGVEPRIPGVEMRPVPAGDGTRAVLIVRLTKSLAGPHVVTLDGHWRFYFRTAAGASEPMDWMQARDAFSTASSTGDQLRSFRTDRLTSVAYEQTPVQLPSGPKIVLHIVPISALSNSWAFAVSDLRAAAQRRMLGFYISGVDYHNNFDGVLLVNGSLGKEASSYVQLFRSGAIEAVDSVLLNRGFVPSVGLARALFQFVGYSTTYLEALGAQPPILIMASILHAEELTLAAEGTVTGRTFERTNLIIPEIAVESLQFDPEAVLRPILDAIWNAGGWERCEHYDQDGRYREP